MRAALAALLLIAVSGLGRAQPLPAPEEGAPLFQRFYAWQDYGLHNQNWAATQDARGVVYVANTEGLLEYDGQAWRVLELPEGSQTTVRSLAVGREGQVYVGGVGEVGVLRPDSIGRLRYASLLAHLPANARDFADVWTTHATPEGVYFQTFDRLMRWDGRRMRIWTTRTRFHKAFAAGDVLYVREEGVGLRRVQGDRLTTVAGGGTFADEPVFAVLPHPRGLLVASKTQGLFLLARGRASPLEGAASAYLRSHTPYNGVVLANPYGAGHLYALATLGGGVLVADEAGRAVRVYGADVGLGPGDLVLHVSRDTHGGLWLALNNGIRRFDALTPLTNFTRGAGLLGSVYDVARYNGTLYAATSSGLFRLVPGRHGLDEPAGRPAYAQFEQVPGVPGQCWAVIFDGQTVLAATNEGVFAVEAGGRPRLVLPGMTFALYRSPSRPDRVFVGMKEGLAVLTRTPDGWQSVGMVAGVDDEVRSMEEDEAGDLWLAPLRGGLLRVRFRMEAPSSARVTAHEDPEHLPAGINSVMRIEGSLVVMGRAGVHRVEHRGDGVRFAPIPGLRSLRGLYLLLPDRRGQFWVSDGEELRVLRLDSARARDVTPPGLRLHGLRAKTIFEEANGVVWLGTEDGLVRYDPRVRRPPPRFPALVRSLSSRSGQLLFGGAFGTGRLRAQQDEADLLVLPYRLNDLRFELAAAAFNRPEHTRFQVRLDGLDQAWGPWLKEPIAEFTNLPERRAYRLHVRARDAQGYIGEEALYTFRVQPPWYRTWWAYVLYVAALTAIVAAVTLWRIRAHRAAHEHERMLNLRLDRMNRRLERTTAQLREANRVKDELLANASHELRTPLTAILGFSEVLEAEVPDPEHRDLARSIHRSGRRLLDTVRDLLDHARLRTGQVRLHPAPADVAAVVRAAVADVRVDARAKGLVLRVDGADGPVPAELDAAALGRVLRHVLVNAVKFTDAGEVAVAVEAHRHEVDVVVRDTGIGIAPGFMPHLFDDFKQASTGYGRTHEGSGLGLAIVRRLVRLMGGEVEAESTPGRGTAVAIRLPRDTRRPFTAGDGAPPPPPLDPALEGVRALGLGVPAALRAELERAFGAEADLTFVDDLDAAARDARRQAFDVVLVGGDAPALPAGIAPAALLHALPGYDRVPFAALADEPLDAEALATRGCDVALPPDPAALLPALADLLGREEYLDARKVTV